MAFNREWHRFGVVNASYCPSVMISGGDHHWRISGAPKRSCEFASFESFWQAFTSVGFSYCSPATRLGANEVKRTAEL